MNILFVYRYCVTGGVCSQLKARIEALAEHNCELLFRHDRGAANSMQAIARTTIDPNPQKLGSILEASKFDLISVIDSPEYLPYLDNCGSAKIWYEVHTSAVDNYGYILEKSFPDFALVVPSQYMRSRIIADAPNLGDRVSVLPNVFVESQTSCSIFPSELRLITGEGTPLLWVGKVDSYKGIAEFFELLDKLTLSGERVSAILVTGGEIGEQENRYLLELIDGSSCRERLVWLNNLEFDMMPQIYRLVGQASGVHVLCSKDESFSMTAVEASYYGCKLAAAGIPVIAEVAGDLSGTHIEQANLEDNVLVALESSVADPDTSSIIKQRFGADSFRQRFEDLVANTRTRNEQ